MAAAVAAGCAEADPLASRAGTIESTPLEPAAGGEEGPLFTALTPQQTGIQFENRFDWDNPRRNLYQHGYAGGGVCAGDYDGDGRPDLYLVSQVGRDRLYRQVADFRFQDVTASTGLSGGTDWGTGAVFADVDDDGDLDLYVCNYDGEPAVCQPGRRHVHGTGGVTRPRLPRRECHGGLRRLRPRR